jgi:hypothetical protein
MPIGRLRQLFIVNLDHPPVISQPGSWDHGYYSGNLSIARFLRKENCRGHVRYLVDIQEGGFLAKQ